jgi:hypothetical protein
MSREIQIPTEAIAALARGDRIEAIKRVREANHGLDLRAAMEAIEAIEPLHAGAAGKPRPVMSSTVSRDTARPGLRWAWAGLVVLAATAAWWLLHR